MTLTLPRFFLAGSLLLIGCISSNASVISLTHLSSPQSRTFGWPCDSNCDAAGDRGLPLSIDLNYFFLNGIPGPLDNKIVAESSGGSSDGGLLGSQHLANVAYALGAFDNPLLNEPVITQKGPA